MELVASLDHKYRSRAKYESSLLNKIESEHLPQRDFFAIFPGCDIPSWFPNKEHIITSAKSYDDDPSDECVIKVDIPQNFNASEWSGIVVCLSVSRYDYYKIYEDGVRESFGDETCWISWSSKALEDDDYIYKGWDHCFQVIYHPDKEDLYERGHGFYSDGTEVVGYLCVMVLELNEKTCWQHLRAHNNSILIKIRLHRPYFGWDFCMSGCGWRVLCKEDIEQWCNTTHDSNKLTEEVAEVNTSQIFLPNYVLSRTIEVRGSS
ncbi:uncharacterized protein LOC129285473 [Prosopis cineraria]|uniref:uncharacterized protein LOC129285473 n=1 Tax=Prosopis cineraria TaxID=364024 RepID=UPI00240F64EA|nr:uncharacterized protein LOC129285473 [Prosopis cineraria]